MTDNFRGNSSRWKYGHAKYFFHTPLEYKIVQKGTDIYSPNVSDNEIKIRPISIGPYKQKTRRIYLKEGGLKNAPFFSREEKRRKLTSKTILSGSPDAGFEEELAPGHRRKTDGFIRKRLMNVSHER